MIKVLFICLGNICRSPMAEAVFRHIVEEKGLKDRFMIDSAGVGDWHIGEAPHKGTRAKLDEMKISYEGQLARQINANDFNEFDYVIAMDQQNMDDLASITTGADVVVKKLMDFVQQPKEQNVPDPYFTKNFDYTYELVKEGCYQLLDYIIAQHDVQVK
ncbi:low molecular weight phosphotyrosine protein phosphatase [Gracilibacillus caseinilyticus]|uniref:protein-tyrosine-phosphatase n=1 Tax=Gracilibacillus caseinilyticus TaxID=2932256 RepID=A0ABY4EYE7_9BACI|nr:low molecular weight protein-tyrosine-phosphatase [Gracilibacillus caseinilyticus]UOQ48872.1 low molecular weight phosphotyrosine protein phosphatase [Gracilibacillus caseinilyticus]